VASTHAPEKCGYLQRIAAKVARATARPAPAPPAAAAAAAAPLLVLPPAPPGTWTCVSCTLNNRLSDLQCVACGADYVGPPLLPVAPAPPPPEPPPPSGGGWPLPPSFALPPLPRGAPPVAGRLLLFCLRILLGAALVRLGRGRGDTPLPPPSAEELAGAAAGCSYALQDLDVEAREAGLVREGDAERLEAVGGLRAALAHCGAGVVALPPGGAPRAELGHLGIALLGELAKR
jgi:hypothetical protein